MGKLFALLALVSLVSLAGSGCGYQLRLVDLSDEEKKEALRHEEVTGVLSSLRADVKGLQGKVSALEQRSQEAEKGVNTLQKQRADIDTRLDEAGLSLRLLQGSLEKRDHRFRETTEGQESRIEELASSQKGFSEKLASLEERVAGLDQSQQQRVSDLAKKVEDLTRNIPPLLADQAASLNALSKNLEAYSSRGAGEIEQLSRSLTSLSKALDLLGQKITAKVDEQDRSIKKISKRLETMEARGSGKRSAERPGGDPDEAGLSIPLAPIFYRVAEVSRDLGDLRGAWEAFGSASEEREDPEWASLSLLRRSEVAATMGDGATAFKELARLAKEYPGTEAAGIARERLESARRLLTERGAE
jgi:DNA repair exonuclease SbcCD ATPase subunit